MLPIIRSAHSEEDMIAIWRYIAGEGANPSAADRQLMLIDRRIELLSINPHLGEAQPRFGERVRRLIVGNYLVYYDLLPDAIHVLRIYHASRNIEQLFPRP
jgi:toxin ParE1/3/4